MGWFGPSKDEVWRQLSQEIGAEFVEGGFWASTGSKVQAHVGPWIVTLDVGKSKMVSDHFRLAGTLLRKDEPPETDSDR